MEHFLHVDRWIPCTWVFSTRGWCCSGLDNGCLFMNSLANRTWPSLQNNDRATIRVSRGGLYYALELCHCHCLLEQQSSEPLCSFPTFPNSVGYMDVPESNRSLRLLCVRQVRMQLSHPPVSRSPLSPLSLHPCRRGSKVRVHLLSRLRQAHSFCATAGADRTQC